jgi:hypothetical protein
MTCRIAGALTFIVVAVGVAVAVYFPSQIRNGSTSAQQVEQLPTAVGTPLPTGVGTSTVEPGLEQDEPVPVATTPPPISLTPESTRTPTPQPGVCPPPTRMTPADFAEPPRVVPASELPGQRVQGGVRYSEAYVTVHLPAGREFIIASAWSQDESNLVMSIYDVHGESQLIVRGDGCEISRLVRQPAADAVFDEIMGSLEIGPTYACPLPVRTTYDEPPVQRVSPLPEGLQPAGRRVQGGVPFELGPITLHLPAGREFVVGGGMADPGGEFFTVADAQTHSGLFLRPDGCEISRVSYPADDAVLDEIVRTLEVPSR